MANISSINGNQIVPDSLAESLANTILTYVGAVPSPTTLTDFNDAELMKVYKIGSWTDISNLPTNDTGVLVCLGTNEGDRGHVQIYVTRLGHVFYRMKWASWGSWDVLASSNDIDKVLRYRGYIHADIMTDLNDAEPMGAYKLTDYTNVANVPVRDVGTLLCFGTGESDCGQAQVYLSAGRGTYARIKWKTWRAWVRLDNAEQNLKQNLSMFVPANLYAVVGKTLYLYHHNMTRWVGQDRGAIYGHNGSIGVQNLGDRFKVSPSNSGSESVSLTLNGKYGVAESKRLHITAVADNPNVTLKALFIGDSLTDMGFYLAQLMHLLPNLELIGTRVRTRADSTDTDQTVNTEGRGSWRAVDYVTVESKNGVTNAFWNPTTSKFDFSYYMSANGYSGLTDVFILLGTNDVGSDPHAYVSAFREIIASISAYDASITVHMILPPPPVNDGYAWGVRNTVHMQVWKNEMFDLWNDIVTNFGSYDIIPAGLNVDCWYDFPHTTVQVNENNPATIEVGNDNVHPSRYGFYNMADVIYAHIIGTR